MSGEIERALEQFIDNYISDWDSLDMISDIKAAVLEEVQATNNSIEDLETRIKQLEEKLERMAEAIK